MSPILIAIVATVCGAAAGYGSRHALGKRAADSAEGKALRLLEEAKAKEKALLEEAQKAHVTKLAEATEEQRKILLEAKEEALRTKEAALLDIKKKEDDVEAEKKRLSDREGLLDKSLVDIDNRRTQLEAEKTALEAKRTELETTLATLKGELERLAGLSREEALNRLMTEIKTEKENDLVGLIRKMDQHSEEEIENRARKVLSLAIERYARSHVADATTTFVELPSDDFKGRIIGKEGRNIKTIEHLTGCELVVDDTPSMISVTGFSPVRRQVAKRAIEALLKDGRIQPARIEEAIKTAKEELAKDMKKAGEDALAELGIPVPSIDPKLVAILGRLTFRTSYGQNVLMHSIEVAKIAAMIGEELGMDTFNLKKGGLFHDIGKAVDHDMQGAHPQIGYNIMKKFGFPEELCYQSIAHHEDHPKTIEGVIVKAADAISGARPGARRNSVEEYLQRLQNLENVATSFDGVEKAYAIQAGREIRVFVEPQKLNDIQAYELARDIAKRVESELTYPGEVRVTVIRETRVTEYAR